jgi:hypothetical protein
MSAELLIRDVAQLGRALDWGARGRGFKSRRPDEDRFHRLLQMQQFGT